MAKKRDAASEDDTILWQRVATEVKPLKTRVEADQMAAVFIPALASKASHRPATANRKPKHSTINPILAPRPVSLNIASPVDLRHGEAAGLDGRTRRKLFRGEVPVNRRLDLHGLTAARAQIRLETFIKQAAFDGCRCVLVITGKGSGVLRDHVPGCLKRLPLSPLVLALAEAKPSDGGAGAFYVLLRRRRQGNTR